MKLEYLIDYLLENKEKEEKLKLKLTGNSFSKFSFWNNPIKDIKILKNPKNIDLFDQNGYHLTRIEQAYCQEANYPMKNRREEIVCCQSWFDSNKKTIGPHLNHTELFERKAFSGEALEQLKKYSKENPMLWKLIKMKPKWGIDLSIDYVDEDGNVFEVFHYEWDDFDYNKVESKKKEIEKFALNHDWERSSKELIKRKHEWENLDFFEQSEWKTNFYGLEPEKFKNIIWKKMHKNK